MSRSIRHLMVAILTVAAVVAGATNAADALAATRATPTQIATDIQRAAGRSDSTTAPTIGDLLLVPDVHDTLPTRQGGLTIWPDVQRGVSYAARYTEGNVQQFIHISDHSAPTAFTFSLQPGLTAKAGPNGSVLLYDMAGLLTWAVPEPWAKDARGQMVPAHYQITADGKHVIKTVEHNRPGVSYPVVADPIVIWLAIAGAWFLTKCAINGAREAADLRGRKWYVTAWGVTWACVSDL